MQRFINNKNEMIYVFLLHYVSLQQIKRDGMDKKKLAGQIIQEHDAQQLEFEDDVSEYRIAMEPAIIKDIRETIEKTKNQDGYRNKDFYVVLTTSVERVLRQPKILVFARKSCPTPVYKQSVWKYNHILCNIEFLWSIPDMILYYHIINNQLKYLNDKETAELAKFVILMERGELLQWVKKENGEKIDAVIKINKEEPCLMS